MDKILCSNSTQDNILGKLRTDPSFEVEPEPESRPVRQEHRIGTIGPKRHHSMLTPQEMQRRNEPGSRVSTESHRTKSARSLGLHGRPHFNPRRSTESQLTLYQDDDHNESLENLFNQKSIKEGNSADETIYRLKRSSGIDMLQQLRSSAGSNEGESTTKHHSKIKVRHSRGDYNESLESINEDVANTPHRSNPKSKKKRHSEKKRRSKTDIIPSSLDELEEVSEKKLKQKKSKKKRDKEDNTLDIENPSKIPARKSDPFKGKVVTVLAPSGSLGIVIGDPSTEFNDGEYDPIKFLPVIKSLSESCAISEKVLAGDKIMCVDEVNCKGMTAEAVMSLLDSRAKNDFRTLLIVRDA